MKLADITGSLLEDHFRVNPATGEVWYQTRWGNWLEAGNQTWNGYGVVTYYACRIKIRIHHLVWCWVHGRWPTGELDHTNGDRSDNRIENLREVTVSQNRTNKRIQTNNKSGLKWVYLCSQTGRWRAEVSPMKALGGKKHRSLHSTREEAYQAACAAAQRLHGAFYNPG